MGSAQITCLSIGLGTHGPTALLPGGGRGAGEAGSKLRTCTSGLRCTRRFLGGRWSGAPAPGPGRGAGT
eukprot:992228-Pyramimonas_sp.AAC.1